MQRSTHHLVGDGGDGPLLVICLVKRKSRQVEHARQRLPHLLLTIGVQIKNSIIEPNNIIAKTVVLDTTVILQKKAVRTGGKNCTIRKNTKQRNKRKICTGHIGWNEQKQCRTRRKKRSSTRPAGVRGQDKRLVHDKRKQCRMIRKKRNTAV